MNKIELVYHPDCPNWRSTLERLKTTLQQVPEYNLQLKAWNSLSNNCPEYCKGYGSPAILINRHEILSITPNKGIDCCRIYRTENGIEKIPFLKQILEKIKIHCTTTTQ